MSSLESSTCKDDGWQKNSRSVNPKTTQSTSKDCRSFAIGKEETYTYANYLCCSFGKKGGSFFYLIGVDSSQYMN